MTKREKWIQECRGWKDVRFRHQGRTRSGIDCAGLLSVTAVELGLIPYGGRPEYPKNPPAHLVFQALRSVAKRIQGKDAVGGDIVQLVYDERPTHLGLLTFDGTVIHAYVSARKVIEEKLTEDLRHRIVAYWRLRTLEDEK